jgi:hypothetical protein
MLTNHGTQKPDVGGTGMNKSVENVRQDLVYTVQQELETLEDWCNSPEGATAPWIIRETVLLRRAELFTRLQALKSMAESE